MYPSFSLNIQGGRKPGLVTPRSKTKNIDLMIFKLKYLKKITEGLCKFYIKPRESMNEVIIYRPFFNLYPTLAGNKT